MKRRNTFDAVLLTGFWILLLLGIFTKNEWTFATAAFFILLDKLDDL